MARASPFRPGNDPSLRLRQVDGVTDIVCKQGKADPFCDGDVLRHLQILLAHDSTSLIRPNTDN
jgi:hypothetical protein